MGKKKYAKRIFLLTNGEGKTEYNEAAIKNLVKEAAVLDVKINIVCLDFLKKYDPLEENI